MEKRGTSLREKTHKTEAEQLSPYLSGHVRDRTTSDPRTVPYLLPAAPATGKYSVLYSYMY